MKRVKLSFRMRAYYMLIVFVIVLFSFGSVAGVLFLLQRMNLIRNLNFSTLVALLLVSSIAGGLTTYFIGRRILTPMVKLSNASKEVARGNYQITVSDASKLEEVQTTFRNFNAMVNAKGLRHNSKPSFNAFRLCCVR